MRDVTFQLNWEPNGFQAPYFLARQRGYYESEDISVRFIEGHGSPHAAREAARGRADIALAGASAILAVQSEGLDPVAVGTVTKRTPAAFYTLREAFGEPLTSPEQLAGSTVAPSATKTRILASQVLERAGIRDGVELKPVDPNTHHRVEHQLCDGSVDVAVGVVTNGVELEIKRGHRVDELPIGEELGVYGMMLVTGREFESTRSETIRAFLRATARGWADATNDPSAAIDALIDNNATLEQRRPIELQKLLIAVENLQLNNHLVDAGWGVHERSRWDRLGRLLADTALLAGPIEPANVWTNEHVDSDAPAIGEYADRIGFEDTSSSEKSGLEAR